MKLFNNIGARLFIASLVLAFALANILEYWAEA